MKASARKRDDGSAPVVYEKPPYRPKVTNIYKEPDYLKDELWDHDILFKDYGRAVLRSKLDLPPRDNIVEYDPEIHQDEFERNINWADCPDEHREQLERIIKENWDAFAEVGMKTPVRGFKFNIDTGESPPICCKVPRYGPFESQAMTKLANELEANGVIEDDDGPWGSLVVLAGKPHQEHKHWSEYVWRLCVSYRPLNAITRPFIFPSRRCDDAARDIGSSRFYIVMDLLWGYWQVGLTEQSKGKTAFFVPHGKKHWCRMPMGALNSHPAYNCIIETLKREWDARIRELLSDNHEFRQEIKRRAKAAGIEDAQINWSSEVDGVGIGSQNIVDDIILHSSRIDWLMKYFELVLQTFVKYCITVSLKKCRFLPAKAEFVGMDITPDGNTPATSKDKSFENLRIKEPASIGDLRLLIGFIGFYQEWLPLFEIRIARWRKYIKEADKNKKTREHSIKDVWKDEDNKLRLQLLDEIKEKPCLARPDPNRRFYLKTDWSKHGKAAVLLQADPEDDIAKEAELREIAGGKCEFDKTAKNQHLRLRPISFISQQNPQVEESWHSFLGEAATGLFAMKKFRRWLIGQMFTWLTDCSGLEQFFESDAIPTHFVQRVKVQLLGFCFTVAHRPDKMMREVDMLNRYNFWTMQWRTEPDISKESVENPRPWSALMTQPDQAPLLFAMPIKGLPMSNIPILEVGHWSGEKTPLAMIVDNSRRAWITDAEFSTARFASTSVGTQILPSALLDEDSKSFDSSEELLKQLKSSRTRDRVDWLITRPSSLPSENLSELIEAAVKKHHAKAIILYKPTVSDVEPVNLNDFYPLFDTLKWHSRIFLQENTAVGGAIFAEFRFLIATPSERVIKLVHQELEELNTEIASTAFPPTPMHEHLDTANHVCEDILTPEQAYKIADEQAQREPIVVDANGIHSNNNYPVPIFYTNGPAPPLSASQNRWYNSPFAIRTDDDLLSPDGVRGIRPHEVLRMYGYPQARIDKII